MITNYSGRLFLRRHGIVAFFLILIMQIIDINRVNLLPTILGDVIQVIDTTGSRITMRRVINGTLAQINGFFHGQIFAVIVIQHTVRVGRTRSDREHFTLQAGTIVIDVVELGTGLVPSGDHGTHGESVPTVGCHGIGEQLGGGRDRDAASVAEFVHAALDTQLTFPVTAIGGSTGHGTEEVGVHFNDLLDGTRGNVTAHGRTRVDGDNDAAVEFEGESGGSLGELDVLAGIGVTTGRAKVRAAVEGGLKNDSESGIVSISSKKVLKQSFQTKR